MAERFYTRGKARRPYLMGKKSLREFFSAPVRYLKELTQKESVLEKPYVDEEYREMHFEPPIPDAPGIPDPPSPSPSRGPCAIVCYKPLDCIDFIWCHPSIWTGSDPTCGACTWEVEGATSGYSWHRYIGGEPDKFWGIDITIDPELADENGVALIHAQMRDAAGNLCGEDLEITCKVCPSEIAVSWDSDNSISELTRGNSGTVRIKNGQGPYSWSVTGTGFSLVSATTTGVFNTLVADATACGKATITVTDFCEDVATGYVIEPNEGAWIPKGAYDDVCVLSGVGTLDYFISPICAYYYIQDGWRKQEQRTRYCGVMTAPCTCLAYCDNAGYCITGTGCANCIDPFDSSCWPYTGFPLGYYDEYGRCVCFCPAYLYYYEWECP